MKCLGRKYRKGREGSIGGIRPAGAKCPADCASIGARHWPFVLRFPRGSWWHRRPPVGGHRTPDGRKVRAPQSRVLGNAQWGKPRGKCHRKQTARRGLRPSAGKGENVGQEPTGVRGDAGAGKPHPEQGRTGGGLLARCPRVAPLEVRGDTDPGGMVAAFVRATGRQEQNPAYVPPRPATNDVGATPGVDERWKEPSRYRSGPRTAAWP